MNVALIVVLTVLATAVVAAVVAILIIGKKQGWLKETIIAKIRPIISDALIEAVRIYQAGVAGYEQLLDEVLTYLLRKVNEATFLTDEEKALVTYDILKTLIDPQLKKLWNQELSVK